MKSRLGSILRLLACGLCLLAMFNHGAAAQVSPVYTVEGIPVDVTDKNAAKAKRRAIRVAQVKGFRKLVRRLCEPGALGKLKDLNYKQIGRLMASLSIEEERTGPGHYIGKLTVRFLPDKIRETFAAAGVAFTEEQAGSVVVVPLWNDPATGPVLWQDNPWRKAWQDLRAENALLPVIVPLGDLTDTQTIEPEAALARDAAKLEALRIRYGAQAIMVAVAAPMDGGSVHATMTGDSPVGRIAFDKAYESDDQSVETAAARAAQRFHTVMVQKWVKERAKLAATTNMPQQAISISVPFTSLAEWEGMRSRLLTVPGVTGVDVTTLAQNGAVVRLAYAVVFEQLQAGLGQAGLQLNLIGGTWVLQPF